MRAKLLSTLRMSVATMLMAVSILGPVTLVTSATASANEICNASNTSNTNNECYWEAQGNGECTKVDNLNTPTFTLPTAPNGQTYTLLVVKGGSDTNGGGDKLYQNPTPGTYTAPVNPNNHNGNPFDVSHAIYCTTTSNTPVTPAAVTFNDVCGTANDSYTVPVTAGVTYSASTGVHNGATGTVTVTATANPTYVLNGAASWMYAFTNTPCETPLTHVTPAAVTFNDVCGTANDSYTVPVTAGVTYSANAGTHTGSGTVVVTATANPTYVLDGTTSWSHTFTDVDCPVTCPTGTGLAQVGNNCKVTICHATASAQNPYTRPEVDISAADGNLGNDNGNGDHYAQHTGPIFNFTMHSGDNWGDIIPPIPGIHSGLNWTTAGQAVYNNDCTPIKTTVTPGTVTFNEVCGTANDTFTIPSKTGVTYKVNGSVKAAGTYQGTGSVTVTAEAEAEAGYMLTGTTSWSHTFTNVACPVVLTPVIPATVTFNEVCGTANDTYTIPSKTGVTYKVNGSVKAAGTYQGTGSVTVTAQAAEDYMLTGTESWSHEFSNEDCPTPPPTDICVNIDGIQTTVPSGMTVDNAGKCTTPAVITTITGGQVLGDSTVAAAPAPNVKELVNTGSAALVNLFVGLFIVGLATSMTIVSRRKAAQTCFESSAI